MDIEDALSRNGLVRREWEKFIKDAKVDHGIVRAEVYDSWKHFHSRKFNPHGNNIINVTESRMRRILEDNRTLISCSEKVLEELFLGPLAAKTNITVSDADGVLIYKLRAKLGEPFVTPNDVGGTTSQDILAVIRTREPMICLAAEHYCEPQQRFCCYAAPIFDGAQQIIGAICFSTSIIDAHFLTNTLVKAAAATISERISLKELTEEHETLSELSSKGFLVLDKSDFILTASKKASLLFDTKDLKGTLFWDLAQGDRVSKKHARDAIAAVKNGSMFVKRKGKLIKIIFEPKLIPSQGKRVLLVSSPSEETSEDVRVTRSSVSFGHIIGQSQANIKMIEQARQASQSLATTLILGESGTGKELVALSIHNESMRAKGPFIAINCGAIPRDLIQSQLFGYEGGSFTGALRNGQAGIFEQANGGTLFLDEVGELPMDAQIALLRVLQSRQVTRVGSCAPKDIDVRIIAATHRNLKTMIAEGSFREDLFYRLHVFPIMLAPLRERKEDIAPITFHLLKKLSHILPNAPANISPSALEALEKYSWPGNIRELENIIERLSITVKEACIELEHLPQEFLAHDKNSSSTKMQSPGTSSEEEYITNALSQLNGNVKKAAKLLKMSRSNLYNKINFYKIETGKFRNRNKKILDNKSGQSRDYSTIKKLMENLSDEQLERFNILMTEMIKIVKQD